ncbi:helix-hairpin-helix domain-containing protein [Stieleria sp. JC731]|uniref:ComEA family DNA-binding protein n=1 Tax=Pirellulaceae TaxID=2691357 RepID=UPI001E4F062A|nr:helix-hairpin-helix domain-containing protein [Stieleria sp. JC731]MCC9602368.1 helix-hairpin-helix domain-containing protein [Stieleria sp. JC731]
MSPLPPQPTPPILSPDLHRIVPVACVILIAAIYCYWLITNEEPPRSTLPAPQLSLNLNRATERELLLLPQIGTSTAKSIILDRQKNGDFDNLDSLTRIRGIGEKTVKTIAPYCFVDSTDKRTRKQTNE